MLALDDPLSVVAVTINLADALYHLNDYVRAIDLSSEAANEATRLGDLTYTAIALNTLGRARLASGMIGEARSLLRQSLELSRQVDDQSVIADGMEGLAYVECTIGHYRAAARLLGAAQSLRSTIGVPLPPAYARDFDHCIETLHSKLGSTDFDVELTSGRQAQLNQVVADVLAV